MKIHITQKQAITHSVAVCLLGVSEQISGQKHRRFDHWKMVGSGRCKVERRVRASI